MSDNERATVLVTGGCGYIGTHTIVLLLEQNYNVVVVDNLVNSSAVSLDRVAEIVGLTDQERAERLVFYQVDICHADQLRPVFEARRATPVCGLHSLCRLESRRREHPIAPAVLRKQPRGNLHPAALDGRIQLPFHCLFEFRDGCVN